MLYNILVDSANISPNHTAVIYRDCHIDYQTLLGDVDQLAAGFKAKDCVSQERVAFFFEDSIEKLWCYYACFKLGLIAVPLYGGLRGQDLAHILNETAPKIIITDIKHIPYLEDVLSLLGFYPKVYTIGKNESSHDSFSSLMKTPHTPTHRVRNEDVPAAIFYTSGSTAKPKGVVHTHRQVYANIINATEMLGINEGDCFLTRGALDFNAYLYSFILSIAYNRASFILLSDLDIPNVFNAITRHAVTIMFMVPSHYTELVEYANQQKPFTHRLRYSIIGGDITPEKLYKKFRDCFGLSLLTGMGMTETLYQTQNLNDSKEKEGSVGLPLPNVKIKIVDDQNQEVPVNTTGEVLISSPAVFLEYWQNSEATANIKRDGWIYSGDAGHLDQDGYLWLEGRKKFIIISWGKNISPMEVENVMIGFSGVKQAIVFGVPNPAGGEDVHACVVSKEKHSIDLVALKKFLENNLANYKVPSHIYTVDALPTNSRGKIDRASIIKKHKT